MLRSLGTNAEFRFEKTKRCGISATKFHVDGGESRTHRHLPHILKMIDQAELPDRAKENAARVFTRLGEADSNGARFNLTSSALVFSRVFETALDHIDDLTGRFRQASQQVEPGNRTRRPAD